jgi:hypothetical protein
MQFINKLLIYFNLKVLGTPKKFLGYNIKFNNNKTILLS